MKRYYLRRYHLLSDSVEKKKARGRALKPFSFCFESTFWAFVEKKKARGRALKLNLLLLIIVILSRRKEESPK